MSMNDAICRFADFDFDAFCASVTPGKVRSILRSQKLNELDFLALLSDSADEYLEEIAQRAHLLTLQHFGNAVLMFTPLYISNYCENVCAYCSFARQNSISRRHLTPDQIREEAVKISESGIRHILVLTGESRTWASLEYLETAIAILRDYFSSVSIEVYPMTGEEYGKLITCGADGLTIYQETYNTDLYSKLHTGGPKGNYQFRLDAPERACMQGIRMVTVGALFGLFDWRSEAFFTALHAAYLKKKFPSVEISVSIPRLRPLAGEFPSTFIVSDFQYVKILTALRLFIPSAGITISTRESEQFRNSVLPLGVTKMSAGTSTAVGGHTGKPSTAQFEIADSRDVEQVRTDLLQRGYQAVLHDWNRRYVV